jgi:hypothetical protein
MHNRTIHFSIERLIDRLQFTILPIPLAPEINRRLAETFIFGGHDTIEEKRRDKDGNEIIKRKHITKYAYGASTIHYITYLEHNFWHTLEIYTATNEIQSIFIKHIFSGFPERIRGRRTITLNEMEAALDFYPLHKKDIIFFPGLLLNGLHIKGSRGMAHGTYENKIDYFCSNGNIHSASKGIRGYTKKEHGKEFFRLEAQLNSDFIENKNKFPSKYRDFTETIPQDFFDPLSIAEYHTLDENYLVKHLAKKCKFTRRKTSSMAHKIFKAKILSQIHDPGCEDFIQYKTSNITAEQIGNFKQNIGPRYNITNKMINFFPTTSKTNEIKLGIDKGYFTAKI